MLLLMVTSKASFAQISEEGAQFTVTQNSDAVDANPGDGKCDADSAKAGDQCTLRAAIMESNEIQGNNIVLLPSGTFTLTLGGNEEESTRTGDLDILENLNLKGSGSDKTKIDGGLLDRVFDIKSTGQLATVVTISGITISNGEATSGKPFNSTGSCSAIPDCGGAIRLAGTAVLSDVITSLNGAYRGGGIAVLANSSLEMNGGRVNENYGTDGGGIYSEGTVVLNNVMLSTNQATIGGAILIHRGGSANIVQSTIEYNTAGKGGGVALLDSKSRLTMLNSVFVGNQATEEGGGIYNEAASTLQNMLFDYNKAGGYGGAVYSIRPTAAVDATTRLTMTESLLEFNEAKSGGGIAVESHQFSVQSSTLFKNIAVNKECGGIQLSDTLNTNVASSITNSTIVSNSGGICHSALPVALRHVTIANNNFGGVNLNSATASKFLVNNSIIADNQPEDCYLDGAQITLPWDESMLRMVGNCVFSGKRILVVAEPKLGELSDNGGQTPTIAPLTDSPAIDRVAPTALCETLDQRGELRPRDGNRDGKAQCDLGAVEVKTTTIAEYQIYLPLVAKPFEGTWRQLTGSGQRLSSIAFDITANQGVNLWAGDIRPRSEGGGLYTAPLPSDCKAMAPLERNQEQFRVLDLLFSGETAIGATFGNKTIFMERASGAWLETPSDINQNVYSLTKDGSGSFYAGTDEAVYKSTNGTEWASIGGPVNINTLEISGTHLWIGTAGDGIQVINLTDNTSVPIDNVGLQRKALEVWDILIADNDIYVATSDGVYQRNADGTWQPEGLQGVPVNTLEVIDHAQFAGTRTEGAWVRMGGQESWATIANGTGWNPKSTVRKLLYQKDLCGGKLFAGTDNGLWVLDVN